MKLQCSTRGVVLLFILATSVAAVTLELPWDPTWKKYLNEQRGALEQVGRQIDSFKTSVQLSSPIGNRDDIALRDMDPKALVDKIESLELAYTRFKPYADIMINEPGSPAAAEERQRWTVMDGDKAAEILYELEEWWKWFEGNLPWFEHQARYITNLPGYTQPKENNTIENTRELSLRIEGGKRDKEIVKFDSEGRDKFRNRFIKIATTTDNLIDSLKSGYDWARHNMMGGFFWVYLADRSPDFDEDEDEVITAWGMDDLLEDLTKWARHWRRVALGVLNALDGLGPLPYPAHFIEMSTD